MLSLFGFLLGLVRLKILNLAAAADRTHNLHLVCLLLHYLI